MPSIDEIIKQADNPFDKYVTGNFCGEEQNQTPIVESIHQQELAKIAKILDWVRRDHLPRTVMLAGDSGVGKSYFLKRLKQQFDNKAFFAYIAPWADSDYIWRHTLRYIVDSLMHVPENQQESQLLIMLKNISAFPESNMGSRQQFINRMRATYRSGIYKSQEFFGVLYDLNNPELNIPASEWLLGDDLDEEDLKSLGVRSAIVSEDAAQKMMRNLGIISPRPIVLCFDQLDNIPRLRNSDFLDIQALFNVNSSLHNYSRNVMAIVSIIMDTWKRNINVVQAADRARIDEEVCLKLISLDQAEELCASRLYPLHQQANPQPSSPIDPLTREWLEAKYPRGITTPRSVLAEGRKLIEEYKEKLIEEYKESLAIASPKVTQPTLRSPKPAVEQDFQATTSLRRQRTVKPDFQADFQREQADFQCEWDHEFQNNSQKITRIRHYDGPELIKMLQLALKTLGVKYIKPTLLSGSKFASCSFSYIQPDDKYWLGLVWVENPNMRSFFSLMSACDKAIQKNMSQSLYLIRNEGVGKPNTKGNQIYQRIFTGSPHVHIEPDLDSVWYLATYYNLVKKANSRELVVADKVLTLEYLEKLIRDSQILHNCPLLQKLGIAVLPVPQVSRRDDDEQNAEYQRDDIGQEVKDFVLDLVTTNQLIGRNILIENACSQFPQVKSAEVEQVIQQLCQEKIVKIVNPKAPLEQQSICWVVPDATGRV
ncbi:MAG: ATP-binding protein [Hormoscilla sp. GUM202]|nr:ATP-binding protein [Hormoscilla sp. GUM202]